MSAFLQGLETEVMELSIFVVKNIFPKEGLMEEMVVTVVT
jgi:hypothetical protein